MTHSLIPKFISSRTPSWTTFKTGCSVIVWGLFRKLVIADRLGLFVNYIWKSPSQYNSGMVICAVFFFSFQIYFDFSAYSDIARGVSLWLGIPTTNNFSLPYFSQSLSEFWQRWHISLTNWLRSYVYFSLGGNKYGHLRQKLNTCITFLVSGWWHGMGSGYLLWGLLHGAGLSLSKTKVSNTSSWVIRLARVITTFTLVSLFWIPFRSMSLEKTMDIIKSILTFSSVRTNPVSFHPSFFIVSFILVGFTLLIEAIVGRKGFTNFSNFATRPIRWVIYYVIIFLIIFYSQDETYKFIYSSF